MRRGLLGLLVLVLAGVGSPAHADATYGSVAGVNGVLYDDCRSYPYAYSVVKPGGAGYWALSTTLVGPDGREADTDYVPEPTSGTSAFGLLCTQTDRYGTYTIHARVEWGPDASNINSSSTFDDAYFTLRKPHSRTTLSVSTRRPAFGQVVGYRVTAYDERPAGFVRRAFAWVHLEKRLDGRWVRIRGGRAMTHNTGRVTVRLRYRAHHRPARVRAVTEPTSRYTRSVSPVVRLW